MTLYKTNYAVFWSVVRAVDRVVYWDVDEAVEMAVDHVVFWDVHHAVERAVNRAVFLAVDEEIK